MSFKMKGVMFDKNQVWLNVHNKIQDYEAIITYHSPCFGTRIL